MFDGAFPPVEDIVRDFHFATLGASALLVVSADLTASKSTIRHLRTSEFQRLHTYHTALTWGLLLFWFSGIYLIWDATAFDTSQFSPKLIAKLLVVSLLTLNAMVIGRVLLPFMEDNSMRTFGEFPVGARLRLALSGAVSSASWISAFCLGYFPHLKLAPPQQLIEFLAPIYGTVIGAAMIFALLSGKRAGVPDPISSARSDFIGPMKPDHAAL